MNATISETRRDLMTEDSVGMDPVPDQGVRDAGQKLDHMCALLSDIISKFDGSVEDAVNLRTFRDSMLVMRDGAESIRSFADEYNVAGVRANGYWSCLRIGYKLADILYDKHSVNLEKKQIATVLKDDEIRHIIQYFACSVDVLLKLRQDSVSSAYPDEDSPDRNRLVASSTEMFVDLFSFLLSQEDHLIATMYGSYCGFWLDNMARYAMVLFVTAIAVAKRPQSALRCLFDARHRGLVLANLVKSADVAYVKRMGMLPELPIYRTLVPALLYGSKPNKRDELFFPRQSKWIISPQTYKLEKQYNDDMRFSTQNKTRVRLFLQEDVNEKANTDGKCIVHCHGGGFVIGSIESNEVYLRDWSNKTPNVPILSIGYSVAPESKFPVALQEVLDSFLYLTSGDPVILLMLGFQPKKITFCGDSAGATLMTALTTLLNDIRFFHKQNDQSDGQSYQPEQVTMPTSLTCLYTPFNLSLKLSPSHVLAVCDSMISAGVMLSCFDAYLPTKSRAKETEEDNSDAWIAGLPLVRRIDNGCKEYVNSVISKMSEVANSMDYFSIIPRLPVIGSWIADPPQFKIDPCLVEEKSDPWYLKPKADLREYLKSISEVTSSPYVSPVYYADFESLSDVELNVVGLHYDPFLDDCICFFKKWQGKKSFRVLDGLPHGFLNFMPFVPEAKKGSNVCIDVIKQSLDL